MYEERNAMTLRLTGARRVTLAAATIALALAVPGVAFGAAPKENITLEVLSVNGSGCPAGSASTQMLSDNTGFAITYHGFRASAGPGIDATEARKTCQLGLLVHVPQGFTFAVAQADYTGDADLRAGVSALHRTNYYFQGSSDNDYSDHRISGPLDGRWHTIDAALIAEWVYAPCGESRVLNINTELRVDWASAVASGVKNSISMHATTGNVDTIFQVQWKKCP
jgi:hypothetical protein